MLFLTTTLDSLCVSFITMYSLDWFLAIVICSDIFWASTMCENLVLNNPLNERGNEFPVVTNDALTSAVNPMIQYRYDV